MDSKEKKTYFFAERKTPRKPGRPKKKTGKEIMIERLTPIDAVAELEALVKFYKARLAKLENYNSNKAVPGADQQRAEKEYSQLLRETVRELRMHQKDRNNANDGKSTEELVESLVPLLKDLGWTPPKDFDPTPEEIERRKQENKELFGKPYWE